MSKQMYIKHKADSGVVKYYVQVGVELEEITEEEFNSAVYTEDTDESSSTV